MGKTSKPNAILIGFSMTGKSSIAPLVAERLGWGFVDTDDLIVQAAGKSIPAIFEDDGEEHFRGLERRALRNACSREQVIIATGGGAIVFDENRELMQERGWIVCLEAKPQTIYRRLRETDAQDEPGVVRPLLAGDDPLERIRSLKGIRQRYYAIADWTIHTDFLSHQQVSDEVLRGLRYLGVNP